MKEYLTTYTKVPFNTFDPDEDKIDKKVAEAIANLNNSTEE